MLRIKLSKKVIALAFYALHVSCIQAATDCGNKISRLKNYSSEDLSLKVIHEWCRSEKMLNIMAKELKVDRKDLENVQPLHIVAYLNLENLCKDLVSKKDCTIDVCMARNYTPLHWAVRANSLECLKILLDAGADVHAQDDYGYTPLHMAVTHGLEDAFDILVVYGSNINALCEENKWSPIHLAAQNNHLSLLKKLIQLGVNKNSWGIGGTRPLHVASYNGSLKCVEALLQVGVDKDIENDYKETPLHYAARGNKPDIVNILIDNGAQIERQNQNGSTPLHFAAQTDSYEALIALLKRGADKEALDFRLASPLVYALKRNSKRSLIGLLYYKANMMHVSQGGWSPLTSASVDPALSACLKLLIEHGADIESRIQQREWAPLHCAAQVNNNKAVEILISYGANVNTVAKYNTTPLYVAVSNNALEAASTLLKAGADMTIAPDNHASAFELGYKKNSPCDCMVHSLFAAQPETYFEDSNFNFMRNRIDEEYGGTLLHELLRNAIQEDMINKNNDSDNAVCYNILYHYLFNIPVRINPLYKIHEVLNAQDKYGNTVLHIAADYKSSKFLKLLIKYAQQARFTKPTFSHNNQRLSALDIISKEINILPHENCKENAKALKRYSLLNRFIQSFSFHEKLYTTQYNDCDIITK